MKKLVCIFILISTTVDIFSQCDLSKRFYTTSFSQCAPIEGDEWVIIFQDNFNSNNLDLSVWNYGPRIRYCNNEQQYYTSGQNITVSNGTLKLITKPETIYARSVDWLGDTERLVCDGDDRGLNKRYFNYTSANIETIKKFPYGMFSARIKIPKGKGFWPAFWLYGGNPVYNELDIFEFWTEDNIWGNYDASKLSKVHHMTSFYNFEGTVYRCSEFYNGIDYSNDFHIYSVIWSPAAISWYVDGDLKRTLYSHYNLLKEPVGCNIEEMVKYFKVNAFPVNPMSIILNLAIESGSDSPDGSTPFPSQMEIDWVRYYQKKSCQDVNITDPRMIDLNNEVYIAVVGEEVTIDCDLTILSGQQLEIVARDNITLGAGFCAEPGSLFNARIDPTICSSTLNSAILDTNVTLK
jgi:beta-glucanase (GH16 family)